MSSVAVAKMTVEEAAKLPNPAGGYYELRHGELVVMTYAVKRHDVIEDRLQTLLRRLLGDAYYTRVEFSFRPLSDHELWKADVASVSARRWDEVEDLRWLVGSPELVIEVLSPSNTVDEMLDRMATCMEGGAIEFWVVDGNRKQVQVFRKTGSHMSFREGQEIPLAAFGGETLPVNEIFLP
jgi:Uma2 family endonuclease